MQEPHVRVTVLDVDAWLVEDPHLVVTGVPGCPPRLAIPDEGHRRSVHVRSQSRGRFVAGYRGHTFGRGHIKEERDVEAMAGIPGDR